MLLERGAVLIGARAVQVLLDELVLDDAQGLEHVRLRDELLLELGAGVLLESTQDVLAQTRLELRSQARVGVSVGLASSASGIAAVMTS